MHPASQFAALGLSEPLLKALAAEKYLTPTPIQSKTIPAAIAGRDVLGSAQTGTGKTAAFALPILQRLSQPRPAGSTGPRCLVLSPTRELAVQIGQSFRTYGKFLSIRQTVIFGGVGQNPQVDALRRGAEIVIATPGRLMDLMEQRRADLRGIEILVLDEADRMLDMGFIRDVKKIVAAIPGKRQTLLFSATMPSEVRSLANTLLSKPEVAEAARSPRPHRAWISRFTTWSAATSRRCSRTSSAVCRCRGRSSSRAPSAALTSWSNTCTRAACGPKRFTATRARTPVNGRSTRSARIRSDFSSPLTLPRAGSISTTSPM